MLPVTEILMDDLRHRSLPGFSRPVMSADPRHIGITVIASRTAADRAAGLAKRGMRWRQSIAIFR